MFVYFIFASLFGGAGRRKKKVSIYSLNLVCLINVGKEGRKGNKVEKFSHSRRENICVHSVYLNFMFSFPRNRETTSFSNVGGKTRTILEFLQEVFYPSLKTNKKWNEIIKKVLYIA